MSVRFDRDNLPQAGWVTYRKTCSTRMVPLRGPATVITKEGPYGLPPEWRGFLAVDPAGWPYPVDADVHAASYGRGREIIDIYGFMKLLENQGEGSFSLSCREGTWVAAIELGQEAEDSPMVASAFHGTSGTAREALEQLSEDLGG